MYFVNKNLTTQLFLSYHFFLLFQQQLFLFKKNIILPKKLNGKKFKTQILITKNSNYDISKTKIVTNQKFELWQLKFWENSNCKCYNSKTKIWTETKLWEKLKTEVLTKLKYSNCDKTKLTDKAPKLKLWQNLKT